MPKPTPIRPPADKTRYVINLTIDTPICFDSEEEAQQQIGAAISHHLQKAGVNVLHRPQVNHSTRFQILPNMAQPVLSEAEQFTALSTLELVVDLLESADQSRRLFAGRPGTTDSSVESRHGIFQPLTW